MTAHAIHIQTGKTGFYDTSSSTFTFKDGNRQACQISDILFFPDFKTREPETAEEAERNLEFNQEEKFSCVED